MKIAMIILAAGLSQRMGVLKPLLPVGHTTALQRAVELGKNEHIHMISVVTGFKHDIVEADLQSYHAKNIRHIYNKQFDDGMFSSVKSGVQSLPSDIAGFLLLPVDLCSVSADTIKKTIAAFILAEGRTVVYPVYNGERGHPPLIPAAFSADIKNYNGPDGMKGYLSQFPADEVIVDDAGILLDMDTPPDYAKLLRHLNLPTYPDEETSRQLMKKYDMPDNIADHSDQVCQLALKISGLLRDKSVTLDESLLASGCLMHDIARLQPKHENVGAKLLLAQGYPDTALLIASHMDLPGDYTAKIDELSLLYLADKLARNGETVPPAKTLENLSVRYADNPAAIIHARQRLAHAQAILDLLDARYGITLADILSA